MRGLLVAAGLALGAVAPALGALPDEIQVYTDDLEEPGEHGIELHLNATPKGRAQPEYPGEVATHHGVRVTPEFSFGLAPGWDAAFYLPFARSADGATFFAGPKLRLKWLPLRPAEGEAGAFAGLNGEIAFVQERFDPARRSAELRPILGYRGGRWLFAFNPILETDLAGDDKGVVLFAPAFKAARSVSRGSSLGLEYYADLGRVSRFAPRAEQSHTLFAVLDTAWLNIGVGRGFSGAADRWTVKAIFSF